MRRVLIMAVGLGGCTLAPDGGPGGFGEMPAPTGISVGDGGDGDGETGGEGGDSADDDGDGAGDSGGLDESGGGETAGDDAGDGSDPSGGSGPGDDAGDDAGGDDDGGDGMGAPACSEVVDLVVMGNAGPANANQNCPQTSYTATVSGTSGNLASLSVELDADVASTNEFTATLTGPNGAQVTLFAQHGDPFSDDFVGTLFDDGAGSPVATAPAPRNGCYAPDGSLGTFVGQPANGTWTLTVQTCLFAVNVHAWELRMGF